MRVVGRLILVTGLILLAACSSKPSTSPRSDNTGPVGGSGAALGSCVERYNLKTLAKRSFAFDGTVSVVKKADSETGADEVTFNVGHWYKGGSEDQITLKTYGVGGVTSAGSISGRSGERMLVTGEDDTLWTCGFTQSYSPQVAAQWETTFKTSSTSTP